MSEIEKKDEVFAMSRSVTVFFYMLAWPVSCSATLSLDTDTALRWSSLSLMTEVND